MSECVGCGDGHGYSHPGEDDRFFFFVVVGRVDVGFLDGKRRGVVGWGVYTVLDHAGGRGPARWPLRTLTDGSPSSVSR